MLRALVGAVGAGVGMAVAIICGLWAQTASAARCAGCSRALFLADLGIALVVLPGAIALLAVVWVLAGRRSERPGAFAAALLGLGALWIVGGVGAVLLAGAVGGWFHAVGALAALVWLAALVFTVRRFEVAEVDLGNLARLDL